MPAEICIRPWKFRTEPFHIAGNLYYVGNRNVSSHLVETSAGLVLLDTAFPQTLYLLLESIRRLGFDPDDIAWILHSHAHYDHCGATRALVELTGARTAMGRADVDIVQNHPELTWAPEYGRRWHEAFEVDRPLEDGDVVSMGKLRVKCIHAPGHTPGNMAYCFEVTDREGKTHLAGLHGGPGTNTLTDDYMAKHHRPESCRRNYLESLAKLRKQPVDIHLGAHPGQSNTFARREARTQGKNPFIDPAAWPRFLRVLERHARGQWGM